MKSLNSTSMDRRQFLKVTSLAGVGFAIGPIAFANAAGQDKHESLGNFVRISKDNLVTVVIKHLDKGQGVTTGLTAIVAEELDADWQQMRWEFAPADAERYNNLFFGKFQGTGGSTSVANSWMQLRQAGAAARAMLVDAAAKVWGEDAASLRTQAGKVINASGKQLSYGELAELAGTQPIPAEPVLKTPDQFRIIGQHIPRIDSPEKTTGKAIYTIDVRRPGMLHAVVLHAPKFGAVLKTVDDSAAKKVPGVKAVIRIERGVAVLATSHWSALQGRNALQAQWDESQAETRSSSTLWDEYRALLAKPGHVVREDGDADKALANSNNKLSLTFELPFLAHATMEPLNCVVELGDNQCQIWTGSQMPTVDKMVAAQIVGLPPEQLQIHTQLAGGSFGRRASPNADYVAEACMIAKAINGSAPVSLQWSREDDMQAGYYRPMALHQFHAALDDDGKPTAWHQRVVSQSIMRGTPFEAVVQGPIDPTIVEGGSTLPYAIANLKVDAHEHKSGIPTLWWRSVGHSHNAYVTEVFMDEVARLGGQDPLALRLALLAKHPRHAGVLKLAAEKAGWGKALPDNQAMGLAVHESFNSFVAQVALVTMHQDGTYKVNKIVCAVDCGIAITPDVIKAQMEGGIGYGLGAAMGEAITVKEGAVEQNNFYDYLPMRIQHMPDIEVHILASDQAPTGVGEPGLPPAAPAVANALRKFLKGPLTKLPFGTKLDLA
ncbi:xanthine dehydrogenase family protein molybdopterin-binding subunit [Bowmanella sp. Y26]|uniref:xanthine dehydrogenase family protein molybdopterin-binding subunit n=1 Tax=Bowmanella yangjiangensis TaxID=2811230 RepID=UPI001BDD65EB|nr:xanthine dehydrogenase family protein molybdopterin-binding subunit [Bowmanella yangjiangensis]MBT1064005.1 xanthine dehydrogenase family protein molybdopterin-binding subunit [Bowmanella yangjiangensis]